MGGVVEQAQPVEAILEALAQRDAGAALVAVADATAAGRDPRSLGEVLIGRLRDAFLAVMKAPDRHLPAADLAACRGARCGARRRRGSPARSRCSARRWWSWPRSRIRASCWRSPSCASAVRTRTGPTTPSSTASSASSVVPPRRRPHPCRRRRRRRTPTRRRRRRRRDRPPRPVTSWPRRGGPPGARAGQEGRHRGIAGPAPDARRRPRPPPRSPMPRPRSASTPTSSRPRGPAWSTA